MMIARCETRSATMPPTRMKASIATARHDATRDSALGLSARAMTWSAITTVHMPSANIEIDTAEINSRYSLN